MSKKYFNQLFVTFICLLISALLINLLIPFKVAHANIKVAIDNGQNTDNKLSGYQEMPKVKKDLLSSSNPLKAKANKSKLNAFDQLPKKWNYKGQNNDFVGLPTKVLNQSVYGNCWAHAFTQSLEASLQTKNLGFYGGKKQGFDNSGNTTYQDYESEGKSLSVKGLISSVYNNQTIMNMDETDAYNNGGNSILAMAGASKDLGLATDDVRDFQYPTGDLSYNSLADLKNHAIAPYYATDLDVLVSSGLYINQNDKSNLTYDKAKLDYVKSKLMQNGALVLSYKSLQSGQSEYSQFFNSSKDAQYIPKNYGGDLSSDHAVTLVGWDDDYSKDNFNSQYKPPANGAFLIKNSWGDNLYKSNQSKPYGYFYLSYYDGSIRSIEAVNGNVRNYDTMKYLDDSGYLYGDSYIFSSTATAYMSNVFHTDNNDKASAVKSVQIVTPDNNTNVEISIYHNINKTKGPRSGFLVPIGKNGAKKVSLNIANFGIHTIELPSPAYLKANSDYAIVVKLQRLDLTSNKAFAILPTETSKYLMVDSDFSNVKTKFSFNQYESYVSTDGINYYDWKTTHPTLSPSDLNADFGDFGNFNIRANIDYENASQVYVDKVCKAGTYLTPESDCVAPAPTPPKTTCQKGYVYSSLLKKCVTSTSSSASGSSNTGSKASSSSDSSTTSNTKQSSSSLKKYYRCNAKTSPLLLKGYLCQKINLKLAKISKSKQSSFTDLKSNGLNAMRKKAIIWLGKEVISQCVSLKTGKKINKCKYNPKNKVNKGAMSEFLWKVAGYPEKLASGEPRLIITTYFKTDKTYNKLKSSKKLNEKLRAKTILWMANVGILGRLVPKKFNANAVLKRGDMAVWMYRLAGSPKIKLAKKWLKYFKDIKTSDKSEKAQAIRWLASKGVSLGSVDKKTKKRKFKAADSINRGSMAEFLYKLYIKVISK